MNIFDWPDELLLSIELYSTMFEKECKKILRNKKGDLPVILAYLEGVDWCRKIVDANSMTHGWNFAITTIKEMVKVGAVSERAGKTFGSLFRDPQRYFHVFNVEIPKVNFRIFPFKDTSLPKIELTEQAKDSIKREGIAHLFFSIDGQKTLTAVICRNDLRNLGRGIFAMKFLLIQIEDFAVPVLLYKIFDEPTNPLFIDWYFDLKNAHQREILEFFIIQKDIVFIGYDTNFNLIFAKQVPELNQHGENVKIIIDKAIQINGEYDSRDYRAAISRFLEEKTPEDLWKVK